MENLIRMISVDGTVTIRAVDSTEICKMAKSIHKTDPTATVALGRMLTAASLLGSNLKSKDDSVTTKINGSGPLGTILAVSDFHGNVKGYVENPVISSENEMIPIKNAVGRNGTLTVIRDMGLKDPYVGSVPIVSGEIAEDFTEYFAKSEQTPSVVSLGVKLGDDGEVKKAGGFVISLLPTAMDDTVRLVEKSIDGLKSVSSMLFDGFSVEKICKKALKLFELSLLDTSKAQYLCDCSKERVKRALLSCGKKALAEMAQDDVTKVSCQFCKKEYCFKSDEIINMILGR